MLAFLLRFAISSSNILSSLPIHKPNLTFNFAGIHLQNQNSITLPQMKQISAFAFHNLYISKNLNPFLFSINDHIQITFSHLTFHKFQSAPIFLTNQGECQIINRALNCNEHEGSVKTYVNNYISAINAGEFTSFRIDIISCNFSEISNDESPGGGLSLLFDDELTHTKNGRVTIEDTTFFNCSSRYHHGGAFAITYHSKLDVTISNSNITSCYALSAPFFNITTGDDSNSKVTVNQCTFRLEQDNGYFTLSPSHSGITIINATVTMTFVRILGNGVLFNLTGEHVGFRQDYIVLENCNDSTLNHIQFTNTTMEDDSGLIRLKNTKIHNESYVVFTDLSYICVSPSNETYNHSIFLFVGDGRHIVSVDKVFIQNPDNYTNWDYTYTGVGGASMSVTATNIDNNATEESCGYESTATDAFTYSIDFTESQFFSESDIFQLTSEFTYSYAFSNSDTYSPTSPLETTEETIDISVEETSYISVEETSNIQPEDLDLDTSDSSDVGMTIIIIIIVIIVLAIVIIIIIVVCCRKSRSCAGCCMCTCCGKADHAFIFQDDEESSKQELFFPDFGKHNL